MSNNMELNADEILQIVFGYVAKISNERRLDNLLMLLANMGRELTLADRCTLWIYDKQKNRIWTKIAHGMDTISIGTDVGLVSYSVKNCETIRVDDAYLDERFNREVDQLTGYRTKSVMVIPIISQSGQVIGAYQALNKMTDKSVFTKQDIKNITLASSYTEKVIESAQLHEEIEQTQKDLILLLSQVSESRSWEVGQHIRRVAEYSKLLASKYGMSDEEIQLFYLASPMHDIGKIAIADNILNKPGPLTKEEFDIVKDHARIGYDILKKSDRSILKTAAIIAYEHHEKWDGTGYPRGLKEDKISVYGRITAIADVFDALSNERCYKKAFTRVEVEKIIMEERGRHFEPKLVDIFFDNLDELYFINDNCKI